MTHAEAQLAAEDRGLGKVDFQWKVARNTGQEFEVGYVYLKGERELFVKRQPHSDSFYFCNQFRES